MLELVNLAFLVLPWVLALLIPVVALTALVVGRSSATWWVAVYFVLILYFPNASWGLVDADAARNFYTRATGTFFFSAINVMLFGLALQAFMARRIGIVLPVHHNLRWPALMFAMVLVGNLLSGQFVESAHWTRIIGPSGLLHVFNLMLAFYVLVSAVRGREDVNRFINLILFCAVTRGLWGLFRFVFMEGDPANFYANVQRIDVRLTFFDINDGLIATMALFVAGWRLLSGACQSVGSRWLHGAIVALEAFIVLFSYRRTAWAGLVLAALLFALCRPARQRWWLIASFLVAGLPLLFYKLLQRSGDAAQHGNLLERIAPDIVRNGQVSFTHGRFAELYAAWLSYKDSPIWGLGTWGTYDGTRFSELLWHRGDFSWMHSGVLHVMLKSGLIGLVALVLTVGLLVRFAREVHATLPESQRGMFLVGIAGLLFMVPTWLIGTPVIEYRTMQMTALCLALPYMVVACHRMSDATAPAVRPGRRFGIRPMRHRPVVLQPMQQE